MRRVAAGSSRDDHPSLAGAHCFLRCRLLRPFGTTRVDSHAVEGAPPSVTSAAAASDPATPVSATASGATAADQGDSPPHNAYEGPKIVVFGGNGFVGSRVCQQGLAMGAQVVSVNRSGRPAGLRGAWLDSVEWVQASGVLDGRGRGLGRALHCTALGRFRGRGWGPRPVPMPPVCPPARCRCRAAGRRLGLAATVARRAAGGLGRRQHPGRLWQQCADVQGGCGGRTGGRGGGRGEWWSVPLPLCPSIRPRLLVRTSAVGR